VATSSHGLLCLSLGWMHATYISYRGWPCLAAATGVSWRGGEVDVSPHVLHTCPLCQPVSACNSKHATCLINVRSYALPCCAVPQKRRQRPPTRVRLYRISPHCPEAPLYLVPKAVSPKPGCSHPDWSQLDPRGCFVAHLPTKVGRMRLCPCMSPDRVQHSVC
jgi:hypothetical protein